MLAFEIVWGWVLLSCTVGPVFAWAFFFPVRREDELRRRGWSNTSLCKRTFLKLQVN